MNADTLTAIGDIVAGVGVVVAGASVIVGTYFGRQAAVASRQAAEQGRLSVELGQQTIEQGRLSVAEARTARREEHLYQDLDRLERLAGLLKGMWAIVDRTAKLHVEPSIAGADMNTLLYDLRAALMVFGRDELPRCRHLETSHDGQRLLGNGGQIQEAESEVLDAITHCREALRALA